MNGHADKLESLAAQLRSSPSHEVVLNVADALEGIAARWAAERATPALVALLGQKADILNKATLAAEREADPSLIGLALDFHAAIADAAGSLELQRLLQGLCNQIQLVMAAGLASLTSRRAEEIHAEHVALIAAIAAKDGDRAEQLASAHVRGARDRLVHQNVAD